MANTPPLGATNQQLSTRLATLETWRKDVTNVITSLAGRIAALEASGGGASAAELAALKARMDVIEAKVCPQESRIKALEDDHIPTP